ncbi:hypothetical protein ACFQ2K_45160 [Streptomyces sanglieri]|uniref:Integral membrane protein n=1 Tax=Streptomyces sanglieri TaxID=193460 RepID=A0ABW2X6Z1_9ACTN
MTKRTARALRAWPGILRKDLLTLAADPNGQVGKPRWLEWRPVIMVPLVMLAVGVLVAGTNQYAFGFGMGIQLGILFAGIQSVACVVALYRPVPAWWASMIGTVMVTPFAANAGLGAPFPWSGAYPWSGVGIATQAWVLFLLALRVRPRIAVETLTITLLLGLACGASTPWRSAHDIRLAIAALVLTVVVGVPCAASWWSVRSWSCRRSSPPRSVPGAPCWRNATASHASCTMWSPTTCRSSPSRRRSFRTWSRTRPTNCGRTPRASAATRSTH